MPLLLLVALVAGVSSPEQAIGIPTKGVGMGEQYLPVASFDGTRYLVSWHDHRNGPCGEAFSVRYDTAGMRIDPTPVRLTSQNGDTDTWGALFDGTNHVVSWVASGKVGINRLTPAGVLLDPGGTIVHTGDVYSFPAIAFDGSNYLLVWTDGRVYPYDVYGARVTKAGVVLDPDGFAIASGAGFETNPTVAYDGTSFVVVWQEGTTVLAGARLTALDISASRLARVRANLARIRLTADLIEADAWTWTAPAPFDAPQKTEAYGRGFTGNIAVAINSNKAMLSRLFLQSGKKLETVLGSIKQGHPSSFDLSLHLTVNYNTSHKDFESQNVVAFIPGTDKALRNEYVVHSAHLDHVVVGRVVNGDSIYNGAHDNASGVASLWKLTVFIKTQELNLNVPFLS